MACLTAWTEVASSGRKLRDRCQQTIAKRRRASSREFFQKWVRSWGMRRRQVQSAVACLKMLIRGHNRQKRDVLRTFACFVRVQMQRQVAMVRVQRKRTHLLPMRAMAAWWEYSRKALRERRVLLKKHMDIQGRLWACHEEESGHSDGIHMYFTRLIFSSWVHEHARMKQDRANSDLISRVLYGNGKSQNAVLGLTMSSVYFSWSSYAVQRKTARRHSERTGPVTSTARRVALLRDFFLGSSACGVGAWQRRARYELSRRRASA